MDTVAINKRGYKPIKPILAKIEAVNDISSLMNFVTAETKTDNSSIIAFGVSPDDKNSGFNIAHIYQTGIGLPDRDYYFETDTSSLAIQQAYRKYLATLFQLTGSTSDAAKIYADIVYDVERKLAVSHNTRVELRDVKANYNKIAVTALVKRHKI